MKKTSKLAMTIVAGAFAAAPLFFAPSAVAQTTPTQQQPQQSQSQQQDRQKVAVDELPEPVQKALEGNAFSGWTVSSAYEVPAKGSATAATSDKEYEIELKKGTEMKTVRLDKEGKVKTN